MRTLLSLVALSWIGWWLTPDQQGRRSYDSGDFAAAAQEFRDPLWRGTAWYRAGEFEQAAQEFARLSSPEAMFNQGNAWLMLGKYDQAIENYEQALKLRPDWREAQENRDLAIARNKLREQQGGDLGDQKLGADAIVFDQNKPPGGQETEVAGEQATGDATIQAMWLRRVQTKPADFLKAKFAYQQTVTGRGGDK